MHNHVKHNSFELKSCVSRFILLIMIFLDVSVSVHKWLAWEHSKIPYIFCRGCREAHVNVNYSKNSWVYKAAMLGKETREKP